jgi:hypothetical protein
MALSVHPLVNPPQTLPNVQHLSIKGGRSSFAPSLAQAELLAASLLDYRNHARGRCAHDLVANTPVLTFLAAARYLERCGSTPRLRAAGLIGLAHALGSSDAAGACLSDGRRLKWRQLYIEAIHVDPHFALAYNHFGWATFMDRQEGNTRQTVTFRDGRVLSQLQLFIEALRLDPCLADACFNLAMHFPSREASAVMLSDGRVFERMHLFAEALRLDPRNKGYYLFVARLLPVSQYIVMEGWPTYRWQLLAHACHCDPLDFVLVDLLRESMPSPHTLVTLADGCDYTAKSLCGLALSIKRAAGAK